MRRVSVRTACAIVAGRHRAPNVRPDAPSRAPAATPRHRAPSPKRRAPEHVRIAHAAWQLDTLAWRAERERACNGHLGGSDERVWRETSPAPRYRDYLVSVCAERRAMAAHDAPAGDDSRWLAPSLATWQGAA